MENLNTIQNQILQMLIANKKTFFRNPYSFYIYGDTGCGKTTILEVYLLHIYNNGQKAKYLSMHFHDYILDIGRLLVKLTPRQIAKKIANQVKVLCFDEFFIESIADAKILYDVFLYLIKYGVSIVTTSNFAPEKLYKNGFNREIMFPKFSDFIHQNMEVIHIKNTRDYRMNGGNYSAIFFETLQQFEEAFSCNILLKNATLPVDTNHTVVIAGKFTDGVIITYQDIIQSYTGIKEYRKLARTFKHIHITNMRNFSHQNEDEAIRFRNLVDIVYTRGMILSFDGTTLESLFPKDLLQNIKFNRCYSRLNEMQTQEYLFSKRKEFKRSLTVHSAKFFNEIFESSGVMRY